MVGGRGNDDGEGGEWQCGQDGRGGEDKYSADGGADGHAGEHRDATVIEMPGSLLGKRERRPPR